MLHAKLAAQFPLGAIRTTALLHLVFMMGWEAGVSSVSVASELDHLLSGHKGAFVFKLKGLISTGHLHASLQLGQRVLIWSAGSCPNAQGLTIFITTTPLPSPGYLTRIFKGGF